jgi:hypothetical protein
MGQLRIHCRQVFADNFSDIQADHLDQLTGLLLNLLENNRRPRLLSLPVSWRILLSDKVSEGNPF